MKRSFLLTFLAALGLAAGAQITPKKVATPVSQNTLLWKVSGKDLKKPTYIFGTMHMICASDIDLSDNLRSAIQACDEVYLELDMDDMMQLMSAMTHMNMRNDTTLSDLLTKDEYKKVKDYFDEHSAMVPFALLERFKPLLVESMVMEQSPGCENMIVMEQLVMKEAHDHEKEIKGLETMDYQLGIFDSIPYKYQADQLVKMVADAGKSNGDDEQEMKILTDAYRSQELGKMEELTKKEDMGIKNFTDILLYNRNADWAQKLQKLMPQHALVVAVGAGHLPGEKGVLNLLRKAGYTVEPVQNDMIKKKTKEI